MPSTPHESERVEEQEDLDEAMFGERKTACEFASSLHTG